MPETLGQVHGKPASWTRNGNPDLAFANRRAPKPHPTRLQDISLVLLAILIGGGMGGLALVASSTPAKWTLIIVLVVATPTIILLFRDIKKLILTVFVLDLPLGIDIAIQNRGLHQGGATGYMLSLTTIVLIVGYALWIAKRRPEPRFYPLVTVPGLVYILMSVVSFYNTFDPQLSAFALVLKIQVFLMYFYVVNHVRTWDDIRLIVIVSAICLLFESVLMALQYFTGAELNIGGLISSHAMAEAQGGSGVTGSRVAGTLAVPGTAALYLNATLIPTLGAYLIGSLINKRLALIAFFLGVFALIATFSRSGWVAFGVAMLILLSQFVRPGVNRRAILIFVASALLIGVGFGTQIQSRITTVTEDKSREQLAYMARNIIKAFPLGVGDNNYDQVMRDKYAHPDWVGHRLYPVHNTYLITWAELGPQGLVALGLFLAAAAWQAARRLIKRDTPGHLAILIASLLGALAAQMIQMGSETLTYRQHLQLLWFVIALIVVVTSRPFAFASGDRTSTQ